MQSRAARAITRAVVAAGTAGAIATAWWLLNRVLDGGAHERIEDAPAYLNIKFDENYSNEEREHDFDPYDSFGMLPVIAESDEDESDDDAVGYTGDYFTPQYDVCMLYVSAQTLVDPLQDVPSVDCRLCRAADADSDDTPGDGVELAEKTRTLSFSETECSSNTSNLSISSEGNDDYGDEETIQRPQTLSKTEQRMYVRL